MIKQIISIILAGMLSACQTRTYTAMDLGAASAMSPEPVETLGVGKYSYRFILTNTNDGTPMRGHPFSITTFKHSKHQVRMGQGGGKVYTGTTDRNGRTPTFQLHAKIPDQDFDLREWFGGGSHGVTFRLKSAANGKTLVREDYFIVVCSDPLEYYRGYTDKNGDTGHVMSEGPSQAILYAGIRDEEFNYRKDCDEAVRTKS